MTCEICIEEIISGIHDDNCECLCHLDENETKLVNFNPKNIKFVFTDEHHAKSTKICPYRQTFGDFCE